LVHILLPWLFHTASVAHRSWGAAGAGSLVFAAVVACSPSLAPALLLLWLIALAIVIGAGRLVGVIRLFWLLVPALALFTPLVVWQIGHGSLWALLADPGRPWAGAQATADAHGRF